MRKLFLSLALLTLLLSLTQIQDWYRLEEKGVSISFPAAPAIDSTDVESAIGKLRTYTYMFEPEESSKDSNVLYGFSRVKYPEKYLLQLGNNFAKGVMDGMINGAVKSVEGKLLSDKEVSHNGIPGRQITVDYGNGTAIVKMNFYMNKTDLYSVQTISYTGKENNQNAERFLKSLVIK